MKSITLPKHQVRILKQVAITLTIACSYYIWLQITNIGLPCIYNTITGYYCPGCGVTRMFLALLQFDFLQAFKSNSLIFLLLPYGVFSFFRHTIYLYRNGKSYPYKKYHTVILFILLLFTIIFTIARNIPALYFLSPQ